MDQQVPGLFLGAGSPQRPRYPAPLGQDPWARAAVAALHINLRCLAILTALFFLILAVSTVNSAGRDGSSVDSSGILTAVWAVHVAAVVVIGYPLGVVVSKLLPFASSRLTATAAFAAVGGITGAALTVSFGLGAALAWLALGSVTAGGARAWAHRAICAR